MTHRNDPAREFSNFAIYSVTLLAVLAVVFVVGAYLSSAARWAAKPAQVFDVGNIEQKVQVVASRWRDLEAQVLNVQAAERGVVEFEVAHPDRSRWTRTDTDNYAALQKAASDRRANYNNECAKYRAFWDSQFNGLPVEYAEQVGLATRAPRDCPALDAATPATIPRAILPGWTPTPR